MYVCFNEKKKMFLFKKQLYPDCLLSTIENLQKICAYFIVRLQNNNLLF